MTILFFKKIFAVGLRKFFLGLTEFLENKINLGLFSLSVYSCFSFYI